MSSNEKKSTSGFFKIFGIISFVILIIIGAIFIGKCAYNKYHKDENAFTKPIDTTDLALEYTVYEKSSISVKVTPLVDIKNLRVSISCYLSNDLLHQLNEYIEKDFLEKGNSLYYNFDISETYAFDRVGLYDISGHKKESCIDFTEEKRVGTIKAPTEELSTVLFTIRFDNSYDYGNLSDNKRFFGRLYITSSINLWDVKLSLDYDFENSKYSSGRYDPDFNEIVANQEIYVDIHKPIGGEENIELIAIDIEKATGTTIQPISVNGQR